MDKADEHFVLEEPIGGYNELKDFTSLVCWKDARELKLFFYRVVVPTLPKIEDFNLNIQIRKSAVSITANIAEGYGRFHYQEGIQFYRISRGSIYELKDHLISCHDLEYINQKQFDQGIQLIEKAKITLNGFINYIKKRKNEKK